MYGNFRFGAISNFILPPSKTVALIEFIEPVEARQAFKSLAYKKYKHVPLYLEWAPLDIINKNHPNLNSNTSKNQQTTSTAVGDNTKQLVQSVPADGSSQQASTEDVAEETLQESEGDFSTLYVKNLNFSTSESDLRAHLLRVDAAQGLRVLSIPEKTNSKGTVRLSMGFGFLEYVSAAFATEALHKLHSSVLEGHKLEVKPSEKRLSVMKSLPKGGKLSSKLLVKNIAFQATQRYDNCMMTCYLLHQSL